MKKSQYISNSLLTNLKRDDNGGGESRTPVRLVCPTASTCLDPALYLSLSRSRISFDQTQAVNCPRQTQSNLKGKLDGFTGIRTPSKVLLSLLILAEIMQRERVLRRNFLLSLQLNLVCQF